MDVSQLKQQIRSVSVTFFQNNNYGTTLKVSENSLAQIGEAVQTSKISALHKYGHIRREARRNPLLRKACLELARRHVIIFESFLIKSLSLFF